MKAFSTLSAVESEELLSKAYQVFLTRFPLSIRFSDFLHKFGEFYKGDTGLMTRQ